MLEQSYYVTAKEHEKTFFLAGPYMTYDAAMAKVSEARNIAMDHTRNIQAGRAAFMAYGITKVTSCLRVKTSLGVL